jgi:hypothetical protein
VHANGGAILTLWFPKGAGLPKESHTFDISSDNTGGKMMLTLDDGSHRWTSTGGGTAVGILAIDPAGKFSFKCTNVQMADSTQRETLNCTFSE